MISPATHLFLTRRMGAQTRSERTDRALLVTAPELVIKKLLEDCNQFGGTSEWLEARPRRSRPLADLIDGLEIAIHEQARMAPTCRYDRSFRR